MTLPSPARRAWTVAVRPARPHDRDAVLAFSTTTFDGWDYIAEVWDDWVADETGRLLVATIETGPDGDPPVAADGSAIEPGRVIAVTHVAMLSSTEAWLEGIRVDPVVRGMGVATELQSGTLRSAADLGATVVRYVTGATNEGSLRLGARHGLLPLGSWRFHGRAREDDRAGPDGRPDVEALLAEAERDHLILTPDADAEAWFARVAADPTFQAGHALYEHRGWAFQSLTSDLFARHLAAREVMALGPDRSGHWSLLVINRRSSLEDGELWPALLAGEGGMVIRLLDRLGGSAGPLARLRLPDPAPMLSGHEPAMRHLGYAPHEGLAVIVERRLV
jgi:GNAT superfamily N-acetyltransferase